MSQISARWVPRTLIEDQKRSEFDISKYFMSRYETNLAIMNGVVSR